MSVFWRFWPITWSQYKSIFESLSILILDSNNGNNQNRKLIKAAAAVAAVSLVSDVDLSWWNSIFYTWFCNYIRQTDNSIGTHRLNPSFFLSNIFLSRGFFITNCNNVNNNTPNIMSLIFQNKKESTTAKNNWIATHSPPFSIISLAKWIGMRHAVD